MAGMSAFAMMKSRHVVDTIHQNKKKSPNPPKKFTKSRHDLRLSAYDGVSVTVNRTS